MLMHIWETQIKTKVVDDADRRVKDRYGKSMDDFAVSRSCYIRVASWNTTWWSHHTHTLVRLLWRNGSQI